MSDTRELPVIENEINRLLTKLRDSKHKCEESQIRELLSREGTYREYFDAETNYFVEFWKYYILNEFSIKKIHEFSEFNIRMKEDLDRLELLHAELKVALAHKHRKKNRRCAQEILKQYLCPYENCNKLYGSDVALNLHVKLKHAGGNKTERERLAKEIVMAQMRGEPTPHPNLTFPPGYLESLRHQIGSL